MSKYAGHTTGALIVLLEMAELALAEKDKRIAELEKPKEANVEHPCD